MKIKALTVQNPWGWALTEGLKVIVPGVDVLTGVENRTWSTNHEGPLAIHVGKTWDRKGAARFAEIMRGLGLTLPDPKRMVYSAVTLIADEIKVCGRSRYSDDRLRCGCGPWAFPGTVHWRLVNLRKLVEPFECDGHQSLWEVDLPDSLIGAA